MEFTLTLPKTKNFCAIDLMNQYAKNTPGAFFVRDQYFNSYILKNCVWYVYDHWKIENHPDDPEKIIVTVYMKEK